MTEVVGPPGTLSDAEASPLVFFCEAIRRKVLDECLGDNDVTGRGTKKNRASGLNRRR